MFLWKITISVILCLRILYSQVFDYDSVLRWVINCELHVPRNVTLCNHSITWWCDVMWTLKMKSTICISLTEHLTSNIPRETKPYSFIMPHLHIPWNYSCVEYICKRQRIIYIVMVITRMHWKKATIIYSPQMRKHVRNSNTTTAMILFIIFCSITACVKRSPDNWP